MRLFAILISACALIGSAWSIVTEKQALRQWHRFQVEYKKEYSSPTIAQQRFEVFKSNLQRIEQLNQLNGGTFGVNEFADLSPEEFRARYLGLTPSPKDPNVPVAGLDISPETIQDLPDTFDWRDKGAVTPVKNQGACGSCWAFSTTGNVEGQWFLAGHNLTSLSEQNLVDCDHECTEFKNQKSCDSGCGGGLQPNAYTYIIKNKGIDTEDTYHYEGRDGQCRYSDSGRGATLSNWTFISEDEGQMAAYLVDHGPLAIAADAVEWQFYTGGVFDVPCGKQLDHGILIVGYGHEATIFGQKDFWWVKNSWGPRWGVKGYLKLRKGVGKCGCNTYVTNSIV